MKKDSGCGQWEYITDDDSIMVRFFSILLLKEYKKYSVNTSREYFQMMYFKVNR
jgi:hypothetical protein